MSKRRLDAQDTIDTAIRYLQSLQSDGWALKCIATDIDYAQIGKKSAILPIEATVTIVLRPVNE